LDRIDELVGRARAIIADDPDRAALWRAYVALESAILDLKLRYGLEGQAPPASPSKKSIGISEARLMLEKLDLSGDRKKLLHDLRACRDVVKALVAGYGRRSTTS
jgi:hypothetical protein